jgi:hypothetical protein
LLLCAFLAALATLSLHPLHILVTPWLPYEAPEAVATRPGRIALEGLRE